MRKALAFTQIPTIGKMLLAILLGNLLYFLIVSALPSNLQHNTFQTDAGLLVDFVLCIVMYQVVRKVF